MRLRTFTASDMPSAMKMVRDALGDDAIILSTDAPAGKRSVTVTAAVEEHDESDFIRKAIPQAPQTRHAPKPMPASNAAVDDVRFEIQNLLRFHNLPELFVSKLMQKLQDSDVVGSQNTELLLRNALEKLLHRFFVFEPLRFATHDMQLMLVGAPGIGKTLTIAKLATKLAMDKQPLTVITTDLNRAGGIEQLQSLTDILGTELQVAGSREELAALLKTLPPRMRVLIDTAGCTPYDQKEFAQLESFATISGIEPILVMPAGGDSLEAIDMGEFFSQLPVRRLLVTRTDATKRFGGILAASAAHGLAFANCSRTPSINDTIPPLDAALLTQLLLRYKS